MTARNAVFPAGRHTLYEAHAYSAAIRSGDLLFVSGQVGSRVDGSPEPDFEAQVRLAFANLQATLKAGGCGLDDIVDVTSFHTDPEHQFGDRDAGEVERLGGLVVEPGPHGVVGGDGCGGGLSHAPSMPGEGPASRGRRRAPGPGSAQKNPSLSSE